MGFSNNNKINILIVKQLTCTVYQQKNLRTNQIGSDKITDLVWIVDLALTQWPKITRWLDIIILGCEGGRANGKPLYQGLMK